MEEFWSVNLTVRVTDAQALWRKARDYLVESNSLEQGCVDDPLIGSEAEPDIGACLQMLLDRSEHLEGAEIENSSTDSDDF